MVADNNWNTKYMADVNSLLNAVPKDLIDVAKEGIRFDQGKLRTDLIPPEPIVAYAHVLSYGAKKYTDRNWELGMDWSRILGSAERHKLAYLSGEQIDAESGIPHLWLWLWNVAALVTYDARGIGKNDIISNNVKNLMEFRNAS